MTPLQNNANAAKKGSRRDFVPQVWPGTATMARRDSAVASVLALGGSNLLQRTAAHAEAADESAIAQAVEALRKALLDKDKARLEELTAAQFVARHIHASESENDGKPNSVKIGVLAVWQKQDGNGK